MSLKEQEDKMLRTLKNFDLTRKVDHWRDREKSADGTRDLPREMVTESDNRITVIGETVVVLLHDGQEVAMGVARCSALEKSFSKRKGRVIATGRALKNWVGS